MIRIETYVDNYPEPAQEYAIRLIADVHASITCNLYTGAGHSVERKESDGLIVIEVTTKKGNTDGS